MDLHERIDRRRSARRDRSIVADRDHLNPAVHPSEPVSRGPVLEQLLDELEPVFDGDLPPDVAVVGPPGSGTSAVVTALFSALTDRLAARGRPIGTTTRTGDAESSTWLVYVDARRATSAFGFYRAVLAAISAETVPSSGVGTDDLRNRLRGMLEGDDRRAVVALDHHDEPATPSVDRARELLKPVDDRTSLVAVGQQRPDGWTDAAVSVPSYRSHELVDVITERASAGLAPGALEHDRLRDLAAWADGNAHDALAALFAAAVLAARAGRDRIEGEHLERAKTDVPPDSVHVDRALALSSTRQRVLLELLAGDVGTHSIQEIAETIAADSSLTAGTVTRILYELADLEVLVRTPLSTGEDGGRSSTVEPRFPSIAFRSLASKHDNRRT
ncbi:Cdc6/Cdc18 family protein [Natrononativus amylolyticus]|uniref:Cdc6/Cdc18 family protein n=1 Tax=Natrononativus amylolyticus TaxID=2963434 RepID=UPI0020CD948F|nr:AAA family ATPase [Natrononativus amylolyticus]